VPNRFDDPMERFDAETTSQGTLNFVQQNWTLWPRSIIRRLTRTPRNCPPPVIARSAATKQSSMPEIVLDCFVAALLATTTQENIIRR
jgi:hypothetical protein